MLFTDIKNERGPLWTYFSCFTNVDGFDFHVSYMEMLGKHEIRVTCKKESEYWTIQRDSDPIEIRRKITDESFDVMPIVREMIESLLEEVSENV